MRTRSHTALLLAAALTFTACGDADDTASTDGGSTTQTIAVTASDDACVADTDTVEAGKVELRVENTGQQVTEVYVYAEGDRVVGEVENVTPGLTRSFQVTVGGGEYEIACKPGQTGDGIRTPLTVTGEAVDAPEATREIHLSATEYEFTFLDEVAVTAGESVKFEMVNEGAEEHEFEVFTPGGDVLGEIGPTASGEQGDVVLTFAEAGTYRFVCDIADHADRGMEGTFEVTA